MGGSLDVMGGGAMSLSIGLDVSELRMGWAIVDYDDQRPLALGVEDLRRKDGGWPEDQVLDAVRHVLEVVRDVVQVHQDEVYVVGIEDVYRGPSIIGTIRHAGVVGMATMAARVVFGPHPTYWPIPNGSWLKPLDVRSASSKKADVKAATREWALDVLDAHRFMYRGDDGLEQDAADALGIATACALLTNERDVTPMEGAA